MELQVSYCQVKAEQWTAAAKVRVRFRKTIEKVSSGLVDKSTKVGLGYPKQPQK